MQRTRLGGQVVLTCTCNRLCRLHKQKTGKLVMVRLGRPHLHVKSAPLYVCLSLNISASTGTRKCTYDLDGRLLNNSQIDKQWNEAFEKGHKFFEQEEYLKAADAYLQATNIRKDEIAYFNIGASYYNAQKYSAAIDNFEQCLRMEPSWVTLRGLVSLIYESIRKVTLKFNKI